MDLDGRSRTPSINSRQFAIPEDASLLEEEVDNSSEESSILEEDNNVLNQLVPEPNSTWLFGGQGTDMFDTSKYLFDSLAQAINGVDFSEVLSLQTKTSASINSKSRELRSIVNETREKLKFYQTRFETGAIASKRIKHKLNEITKKIEKLKLLHLQNYPIEYNQAKDKIYDLQLNDV